MKVSRSQTLVRLGMLAVCVCACASAWAMPTRGVDRVLNTSDPIFVARVESFEIKSYETQTAHLHLRLTQSLKGGVVPEPLVVFSFTSQLRYDMPPLPKLVGRYAVFFCTQHPTDSGDGEPSVEEAYGFTRWGPGYVLVRSGKLDDAGSLFEAIERELVVALEAQDPTLVYSAYRWLLWSGSAKARGAALKLAAAVPSPVRTAFALHYRLADGEAAAIDEAVMFIRDARVSQIVRTAEENERSMLAGVVSAGFRKLCGGQTPDAKKIKPLLGKLEPLMVADDLGLAGDVAYALKFAGQRSSVPWLAAGLYHDHSHTGVIMDSMAGLGRITGERVVPEEAWAKGDQLRHVDDWRRWWEGQGRVQYGEPPEVAKYVAAKRADTTPGPQRPHLGLGVVPGGSPEPVARDATEKVNAGNWQRATGACLLGALVLAAAVVGVFLVRKHTHRSSGDVR